MKLKKITVSGFKSFVDQTHVTFNAQIMGVVGPNGCGKSNVIDAVRWVMGESSARMLRGDSMTDVIFNGSSSRKPVGRASVELYFDNRLGRIKSHYKQFAEIAIKRILNRDGKSEYRINDKRVRRKDVLDLFRGTGLGPRSYSIIEQGMVSRIVEAKPEELRAYVEEAAGISRYKERRRETETRIRQTRENIERSEDIRSELLAQLRRLKRQSQAAERYKKLQARRRETQALHYRLHFDAYTEQIRGHKTELEQSSNQLEKALSVQRELEATIEQKRSKQGEEQDKLTDIQAEFYKAGADISRIEQKIEHIQLTSAQDAKALADVNQALQGVTAQLNSDQGQLEQAQQALKTLLPELEQLKSNAHDAQQAYEKARHAYREWQNEYGRHSQQQQSRANQKQLQLSIIEQISRQQGRAAGRRQQLDDEQSKLKAELSDSGIEPLLEDLKSRQSCSDELQMQIDKTQLKVRASAEQVVSLKNRLNEANAMAGSRRERIQSLQEFQAAAMSSRHRDYKHWLDQNQLSEQPRLAQLIKIDKGWERAADRILTAYLDAMIDDSGQHDFWLKPAEHAVTLISVDQQSEASRAFSLPTLASCMQAEQIDIASLSAGVYVAEDAAEAQQHRLSLRSGERIVTRDGVVYGANWVSHVGLAAANTGYLVREEEIQSLSVQLTEAEAEIEVLAGNISAAQQAEADARTELRDSQQQQQLASREIADTQRKVAQIKTAQEYTQSRLHAIETELNEIQSHGVEEQARLDEAEQTLQLTEQELISTEQARQQLLQQERPIKEAVEQCNLSYREQQNAVQAQRLDQTRLETSIASLEGSLQRMQLQQTQHQQRKQRLLESSDGSAAPLESLETALQQRLDQHSGIETRLTASRTLLSDLENQLRELQSGLSSGVEKVNQARATQEKLRMSLQDRQIRQQTLAEEAARDGCDIDSVERPDPCPDIQACEQLLADLSRKIEKIGAVNLVAIEEFETQSERAEYLEKQHQDLQKALDTLEKVIHKIDRETRVRFEETYTLLNKNFSAYFPKLFGGGRASLNLTSDDWLSTGITVMAQPPGKRNSTIHLLSGGEKALTAVSLLFGLFELNPAPFCIMDEVDAPLDDANVERFCDTLKSFSKYTQIIVITHNKITMQAASGLIGVTMQEPGVSRVVTVDIEQALELVDE